ncbi:MAG: flagellar motor protein MotB [Epsilonproteobacteria bacterium]|nr:MAG: flagellar motor protein MotB [Campylobacterota bacterium]
MAKDKCPECPKCLPGWLVQFGDLMSLLLCFFILLLSMATMDKKKVEEYFEIMRRSMGFLEGAADTAEAESQTLSNTHASDSQSGGDEDAMESESDQAAQEVEEIAKEFNETNDEEFEDIEVIKSSNEFSLDIPSSLMFDSGEYTINNPAAKRFIAKLARIIRTMPESMDIEVMGYAATNVENDEIPRDSWDVSALRAISVVKELIRNRIDPVQLKVSAYGSYHPKSDDAGDNRRVELKFVSAKSKNKVVAESNFFDRIEE